MTSFLRAALVAGITSAALATTTDPTAAASSPPPIEPVSFELVGMINGADRHNLAPGLPIRVGGSADMWKLEHGLGGDTDPVLADGVFELVDARYPTGIPDGTALLVANVHMGCFPAESVAVVRMPDGEVMMRGEPSDDEATVQCFTPLTSVAVVAVDSREVPPGSADGAELVVFAFIGAGEAPPERAVELGDGDDLAMLIGGAEERPPLRRLSAGKRRFAFALPGCRHTTAELIVTRSTIDATLEVEPGEHVWLCAQAEWFLAVFDISADRVPSTAVLACT